MEELLDRIEEVCPLPSTAQRVLALTSNDLTPFAEIVETLALDPALAGEVLRIANSPMYGARQVATLEEAALMLGAREIGSLCAAMSMLAAFASVAEVETGVHQRAVLAGAISKQLAAECRVHPSVAFLAGLLSEIGVLALLALDSEYAHATQLAPAERDQFERRRFGNSQQEIGAALLRRNSLPDEVCCAVEGSNTADLTALTQFSAQAAKVLLSTTDVRELESGLWNAAASSQSMNLTTTTDLLSQCLAAAQVATTAIKKANPA